MKTTFPLLIALLALLHCALAPACAFAVTGQELATLRGERSYPQALDLPDAQTFAAEPGALLLSGSQAVLQPDAEKLEALTAQLRGQITDLGDAVDFLSVFADDCVGALVNRANHLQSLYTLTEDELSASDRDTLGAFIADYSLLASQLFSQIEFQLTKLSYAYSRIDTLVSLVRSGEYSPAETDEYLAELAAIADEASERLKSFTDDEQCLEAYLTQFYTAHLMIAAMEEALSPLHDKAQALYAQQAQALAAQENGGGLLRAASAHVSVISRSQYAVTVRDEGGSPIRGAQVEVRVLNGDSKVVSTVKDTTDDLGYAFFCYDDFQPGKDDKANIDVRVHAAGFRTQASGKLYVQGGGFTVMSLEPDDGSPYIVQTTYNDEDIVRVANGIYITPYNHALQSLSFCVNTASAACHVQLYQPGSSAQPGGKENVIAEFDVDPSRPSADLRQDDTYATEYSRTFSAEYGSDAYFQRNQPVYLRLTWQQGGEQRKTETLTLFSVKKARVPNPTFVNDTNQFMGSIGFTLPKDWPIIGGSRLTLPTNSEFVKFTFFLNTDGTLYAGVSANIGLLKNGGWKNQTAKNQAAMEAAIAADNLGMVKSFSAGVAGNYDMMHNQHVVAGFSASLTPYLFIIARRAAIEDEEHDVSGWYEYQGDFSVGAIVAFKFSATFQATAGPVPVFLGLDFSMGFNLGLKMGMKFDMLGAFGGFRNFSLSDDTGFYFSPFLNVALTAGAGIPSLAYVGIQGRFYLTADIVFSPVPSLRQAKGEVSVSLDVCIFFFQKLFKLWSLTYSWTNPYYTQSAMLLSSLEEELAQTRTQRDALTVSRDASPGTQQTEKTTVRAMQPIGAKDSNVLFVPVSMKHPFTPHDGMLPYSLPDMCLALWLQKRPNGQTLLSYSSTQLNTQNDMDASGSTAVLRLNSEFNSWEVVDFDVEYLCMPDRPGELPAPPMLYIALSIAPIGTPDSEVALKSRLLFMECQVLVMSSQTQPRVALNCLQQKLLSTADAQQPGITMPRIERTNSGYLIGAIATYPTASDKPRRAVLLYDSAAASHDHPWAWSIAQDLSQTPGDGWEIAEFQLLDRLFRVESYSSVIQPPDSPGYVLLMRSTTDEAKSRFYFFPGKKGTFFPSFSPVPERPDVLCLGGDTLNFSNIQLIEEYDELYNTRQVGIGALRLLRDAQTGQLSTSLCLMTLDRNQPSGLGVWLSLKPTDTGVSVGADGLSFLEINGSYYACWLTSTTNPDGSRDYELQASYISLKHGIASQPFTLLHLCRSADTDAQEHIARASLLPLTRGSQGLLYGVLLEKRSAGSGYRWAKFSYGIQMSMEVTALVPEAPIILPGDTFTSRIRVRNTGMLPIYNFSIDYLTRPEDSASSSNTFVKQVFVDMQNIDGGEVRNVDRQTGAATGAALTGETAVYRMEDGSRERNGEIAHTLVYITVDHGTSLSGEDVRPTPQERTVTVASLPADGTLDLRTSFTAPLDCWGERTDGKNNVILTARVHNLETGTDLAPQADTAVYASERGGAVTLSAPLSAQNDEGQSAESDKYFGSKLTLPAEAVYYAPYDLSGARIDVADFDLDDNNLMLEADVMMVSGVPTACITLRNLDGTQAEDVIPMLVAMVDGRETWRLALKTALSGEYTRSLSVPLSELAGGKPYSVVDLYLVQKINARQLTQADIDYSSYGEADSFDNHRRLSPVYDFYFIVEPESASAFTGEAVTLTAQAAGPSGPFTYQWVEVSTDGTLRPLRGETGTTLTLPAVTLAQSGTKYLCIAANSDGILLQSRAAALTVSDMLPVTGDASQPAGWLALLAASGLMLLALIAKHKEHSRQ